MEVQDDCKVKYSGLKDNKTHRSIVFKISDDWRQIAVEKLGEPTQTIDEFTASLPDTGFRHAVFDYEFVSTEDGSERRRIVFISWSPDDAKIKEKMLYASSKVALRRELAGIHVELQAASLSELDVDKIKREAA